MFSYKFMWKELPQGQKKLQYKERSKQGMGNFEDQILSWWVVFLLQIFSSWQLPEWSQTTVFHTHKKQVIKDKQNEIIHFFCKINRLGSQIYFFTRIVVSK